MEYTEEKPTEVGYYWLKEEYRSVTGHKEERETVVYVNTGGRMVQFGRGPVEIPSNNGENKFSFAGPLEPPELEVCDRCRGL